MFPLVSDISSGQFVIPAGWSRELQVTRGCCYIIQIATHKHEYLIAQCCHVSILKAQKRYAFFFLHEHSKLQCLVQKLQAIGDPWQNVNHVIKFTTKPSLFVFLHTAQKLGRWKVWEQGYVLCQWGWCTKIWLGRCQTCWSCPYSPASWWSGLDLQLSKNSKLVGVMKANTFLPEFSLRWWLKEHSRSSRGSGRLE